MYNPIYNNDIFIVKREKKSVNKKDKIIIVSQQDVENIATEIRMKLFFIKISTQNFINVIKLSFIRN